VRPDIADGNSLFTWGSGGAVLAGCVDLLVAVLLTIGDPVAGEATRFTVRDLGLAVGAAGLLSFGLGALALRGRAGDLHAAAALHGAIAGAAWVAGRRVVGPLPAAYLATVAVHAFAGGAALAGAFSAPAPGDETRRRAWSASAARAGAENLESVLVAIVFALAIRHFAVEAYKIPTESMSPTLFGDNLQRGPGDRVLVDKWPAFLGGPRRWQVWVFRPPENRTINYVKRVVGLPGEGVEIRDGDIYVDGKIARKPGKTREEMWFPVWPRPDGQAEKSSPWTGEGFVKAGDDGFTVRGAQARRLLHYGDPVRDTAYGGFGEKSVVGDVRLRFDVEGAEPGTELTVRITGRAGPCEARVSSDGALVSATCNGRDAAEHVAANSVVRSLEVSFADLLLDVRVNGRTVVSLECEPHPDGKRPAYGVDFGVEKGGATFREVRLDRDVFYTGSWRFQVPEGHYLFLGDNSANSQDSRMWKGWEVRETAPGGRVFYTDSSSRPEGPGTDGRITFRDRNQVLRSYLPGEIKVSDAPIPLSFVAAEDLHGRAFAVFWPPRWFTKAPGGRVRFLP
jgi:signal peptidase I